MLALVDVLADAAAELVEDDVAVSADEVLAAELDVDGLAADELDGEGLETLVADLDAVVFDAVGVVEDDREDVVAEPVDPPMGELDTGGAECGPRVIIQVAPKATRAKAMTSTGASQ